MPTSLLATKLYIPAVRPDLVPRRRLVERLDEGVELGRKLGLISAPAGFGKTTLVAEWIAATNKTFAWISLDKGDNDPARFFAYLLAALRSVDETIGQSAQQMLEAAQSPPAERLVTALINDVAATATPLVLVLDDYHAITELAIHEAVSFMLERQPPQVHLAITTRQDPSLPLSRLRGRSQVTEIRESDLRFTAEEAAAFLNSSMGLQLAPSDIDALEARTEGWITGLQLAALSMQGRDQEGIARFIDGFSGRYHFVLDYLTDEVLQRQSQPVQTFLLRTSILERMCDSLCDALLAGDAAEPEPDRPRLEQMEAANLFTVPLDDERQWYRYHRLFAELLQARLQETRPELIPELHRRAAAWYEQHKFSQDAVHHALASGDHDLAADTIERAILSIRTWRRADAALMLRWLQALPDAVVEAKPNLRLFFSRTLYISGQVQAAEATLAKLETWLADNPSAPDAERLRGLVAVDRASYAAVLGNVQQAKELSRQALARVAPDDPIARFRAPAILGMACLRAGDVSEAQQAFSQAIDISLAADLNYAAVPFLCNLAETQIIQGQLRQARKSCEQAQELSTAGGKRFFASGFVGLQLSKLLYEWNDLVAAERHLVDGLELLSRGGISESFGSMHAVLALIKQAQGKDKDALEAARQAVELVQQETIPRLTGLTTAYQARVWLAQGKVEAAGRWARDFGQSAGTEYLREFEELTLVRVLLAEARPADVLSRLDALLPPAQAAGRWGAVLEIHALRALACRALNDEDAALAALEQALALGELEGYVRTFVDCGDPMRALLKQASTHGVKPEYVSQLLAAFPLPGAQDAHPAPGQPLVEPLTGRELEVLALLAQGLANREIGQRLFISLATVKSHTSSIYGKLDVHSRDEAVARARALGLLAPS